MSNKRIYQVAKEYNVSSDALLSMLRELGFSAKSHMSVVEEKMLQAIQDKFTKEKEELKKEDVLKKKNWKSARNWRRNATGLKWLKKA